MKRQYSQLNKNDAESSLEAIWKSFFYLSNIHSSLIYIHCLKNIYANVDMGNDRKTQEE